MQAVSDNKGVPRGGRNVPGPAAPKKKPSFFNFFTSSRISAPKKNIATVLKEPVLKKPHLNAPRAGLTEIRSWVALEERIVHDYKEQRTVLPKKTFFLPKSPAKQPFPAFETFTTRTAVPLPAGVSKVKDPIRAKRVFSGIAGFLLVCGWLAAGAYVFLYVQEILSNREIAQKLAQFQNEKNQQEQAYGILEKKFSEERMRTVRNEREKRMHAARYESEIAALRGEVQTQKAIVNALKAQNQAFEKIVDQAGMSAASAATAGISGEITAVNHLQGFFVISLGAAQGASSGRWITVSRDGTELAVGRIDRVYPNMSAAVLREPDVLQTIREGDSVSFYRTEP